MNDDAQLLRQYMETGSEPAFRELVERHIQMVNATARRMVAGDAHLAQDVTQLVFTDLARKAATLPADVVLGGWLHRHTCFTAAKAVRTEIRRRARERTAMELNAVNDSTGAQAHWAQVAPVLDDALNRLEAPDRDALVLRFLQQQDLRSVGRALGTSDDTAQKRVTRALEKLRAVLTRRGVAVTSTALLAASLEAAPFTPVAPGLAALVSAHALSTAATAAGTGLTLLSLKTMITSKLALGLAATVAIAGTTAILVTHSDNNPASTAATKPSAPLVSTPIAASLAPQISTANKVEAPKLAPAPAGNKPATPDDIAASTTTNMPVVLAGGFGQNDAASGRIMGSGGAGVLTLSGVNPNAIDMHTASVFSDGTNVIYTKDGVAHPVPEGIKVLTISDSQTGGMVAVGQGTVLMSGGGAGGASASGVPGDNSSTSSMRRAVKITNGQMTVTTTQNGVTTTSTGPAPAPGTAVAGSAPSDTQTMTITDQNGVTHTIQVPIINGSAGSGAVMITTNPDGTTNTLQVTPNPDSP